VFVAAAKGKPPGKAAPRSEWAFLAPTDTCHCSQVATTQGGPKPLEW
jgi:hypothetical protein